MGRRSIVIVQYSHETPWLKPAYMQIQACGARKDKEPFMIIYNLLEASDLYLLLKQLKL
jgi:hypothetical protein